MLDAAQAQSRRVISRAAEALEHPDSFRLFAAYEGSFVAGAVCFKISDSRACAAGYVSAAAAQDILAALSEEFGVGFLGFESCNGPPIAVEALANACSLAFGRIARARAPVETMVLDQEPCGAVGVHGALRVVAPHSKLLPLLARWFKEFEKDTENEAYTLLGHQHVVDNLSAAAGRGDLFVWEVKEKPVSMVLMGCLRPKQVLCVYTVPHQRGKGYGQAATSAACGRYWHATEGSEPIFLSAAHKYGAARVYSRIGFRSGGWLHGVTFDDWCPADGASSHENHATDVIARALSHDSEAPFGDFNMPLVAH